MKLTLQDHIDDFREAIGDDNYSEAKIIRYLNKAQDDLASDLDVEIPIKKTISTVAYQEEYNIPSTIRRIVDVRVEADIVDPITKEEIERLPENTRSITGQVERFWREGSKIGLYYIPDGSAETTAIYTAVSSVTATSIVVDYTASLPSRGAIIVDDEVIYYTNLSHTSTTYTTLSGCTRGAEGTVAAIHLVDATVTWRDIEIFGYGYPGEFLNKPNAGSAAITAGTGLTEDADYIYQMTFYSHSLQMESLPYLIGKITPTGVNCAGSLSSLAVSTHSDVDYKRIYRTKANGKVYYYIGQVANATTTYSDATMDSSLTTLYADPYSQIPEDHHELITLKGLKRFFRDREEWSLLAVIKSEINEKLPLAIFREKTKDLSRYTQKPLPE